MSDEDDKKVSRILILSFWGNHKRCAFTGEKMTNKSTNEFGFQLRSSVILVAMFILRIL